MFRGSMLHSWREAANNFGQIKKPKPHFNVQAAVLQEADDNCKRKLIVLPVPTG